MAMSVVRGSVARDFIYGAEVPVDSAGSVDHHHIVDATSTAVPVDGRQYSESRATINDIPTHYLININDKRLLVWIIIREIIRTQQHNNSNCIKPHSIC